MKKSLNLVDRIKTGVRNLVVGAAVGLASLAYSPKAEAHESNETDGFAIHSFQSFVDGSVYVKTVGMSTGTNLEVLDTIPPALIVETGSYWYVGFINYVENPIDPNFLDAKVVGYAENIYRDAGIPDRVGQIIGKYLHDSNHLQYGEKPNDVYIVYDGEGDGLGYVDGGNWFLGADDKFYYSKDVMFGPNKVYGDVNELPALPSGTTAYLSEMIVDDRSIRTGTAGMNELLDLTENWLSQDCHPYNNNDCNGADWNLDGDVDFYDFSYMAVGWNPEYVSP